MKCGVVDVGSNTIRLSLYQYEGDGAKLLFSKKDTVGLAGYIRDGVLSEGGISAACRTLSGFRILLDNLEIPDLYVFGTAPLRNISNTGEALAGIQRRTGLQVEVLSGAEETALSFRGAMSEEGSTEKPSGLLADIGGGSTELAAYRDGVMTGGCSLPIGSLSLYTKHVDGLFPGKEERRAIRREVERALERADTTGRKWKRLTGVGGAIRAAAKLCNAVSGEDPSRRVLQAGEILALCKRLKKGDRSALRAILRTSPDRVHTLLPGLLILSSVIRTYGIKSVRVSARGVREGYLLDRVMGKQP